MPTSKPLCILIFRLLSRRICCVPSIFWVFPCRGKLYIYWLFLHYLFIYSRKIFHCLGHIQPFPSSFPFSWWEERAFFNQQNSKAFSSGNEWRGKTLDYENQNEICDLQNVVFRSCDISLNLCFIHLSSGNFMN